LGVLSKKNNILTNQEEKVLNDLGIDVGSRTTIEDFQKAMAIFSNGKPENVNISDSDFKSLQNKLLVKYDKVLEENDYLQNQADTEFFKKLMGTQVEIMNLQKKSLEQKRAMFEHEMDRIKILEKESKNIFAQMNDTFINFVIIMTLTIAVKVIATSVTFGSGGVGGIFAPTLFMGANTGVLFASLINRFNWVDLPVKNFALIGMAGLIAGVLHAPLTGLFLIADLSGGYSMFLPLMITATISFVVAKTFEEHSVYTHQLAHRKELLTHDKDQNVMTMMEVNKLIETDFAIISPEANLGDLVEVISKAHRNLFPVVDDEGMLKGMVKMDDIREIIFKPEKYDKIKVKDLMYMPEYFISPDDSMEDLVEIFRKSSRFNIAVIDKGKYRGFISRANAFTAYRNQLKMFSSGY